MLDEIVGRLVEGLQPEQVILFGSYAYGEPNVDSDIDLLVIVADSDEPRHRRAQKAYHFLWGLPIPTEVIVMTRKEVERSATVVTSLVYQALHRGRVLYG
ncbi:MAG: nucleotidyltransferase domain-containing protein [Leptolyngbyaceae cyanobacterium SL_7_1]|nr:nucleotidyltransferase domain-containing protein [Leptolyngbyaceae cyanobacterium SL_7_1]